jgi:hypothetical protein
MMAKRQTFLCSVCIGLTTNSPVSLSLMHSPLISEECVVWLFHEFWILHRWGAPRYPLVFGLARQRVSASHWLSKAPSQSICTTCGREPCSFCTSGIAYQARRWRQSPCPTHCRWFWGRDNSTWSILLRGPSCCLAPTSKWWTTHWSYCQACQSLTPTARTFAPHSSHRCRRCC